jgi:hypothetical protein
MVLSNYYNLVSWLSNKTSYMSGSSDRYYPSGVYSMVEEKTQLWCCFYDYDAIVSAYVLNTLSLWVGSGDTAVDPGDWKLAADITSSFSNIQRTQSRSVIDDNGTGKLQVTCTFSGVNNTENSIIVKEIGMAKSFTASTATMPNINNIENRALYIRELLSSPVTVAPGETFTCTMKWVMG